MSSHLRPLLVVFISFLLLSACTGVEQTPPPAPETQSPAPAVSPPNPAESTPLPSLEVDASPAAADSPSPEVATPVMTVPGVQPTLPPTRTPLAAGAWMTLPVIPTVSETAREIYLRGIAMGNNPHAFSKIGDCQSITTYFLAYFDLPGYYELGDYTYLQETIDWYTGSFERESLAVRGGFNAAAILSPLRADPTQCNVNESPVACEIRVHNPSLVLISMEEWWTAHPENYENYMRQILELVISEGVLPILATKADNLEGDHTINQTIARLAWEYDIPLWNFWLAVQTIPNHGLIAETPDGQPDMFHLTHSASYYNYSDPYSLQSGWGVRNLTALQSMDAVRNGLAQP